MKCRRFSRALAFFTIAAILCFGTVFPAFGQVPSVVFSHSDGLASVNGAFGATPPDYQGASGHLAVNKRGDVFFVDAPFSYPTSAFLVEIPAGGGAQVELVSNLGYGAFGVYVDSANNLYMASTDRGDVDYIPFIGNQYPALVDASALSSSTCTLPFSGNTAACQYPVSGLSQGYDVALDGAGNLYVVNKIYGSKNQIIKSSAGVASVLVDGLTENGNAQLAVTSAGDVYYADSTSVSLYAAGSSTPVAVGTGLSNPSGVALDGSGNLYISDTGNSRIVEIPNLGGARNNSDQFTVAAQYARSGMAIDSAGNLYYVGLNGNSINRLTVNKQSFAATAIGTTTAVSTLSMSFAKAATFGNFTVTGPFAVSAQTCTNGTAYAVDAACTVSVTYTATAAGPQTGSVVAYDNSGVLLGEAKLSGSGSAATLNVDPGTITTLGSSWAAPSAVATDTSGNVFIADGTVIYEVVAGVKTSIATGFSSPSAIVVDGAGNLYIGDTGNSQIVEVPYNPSTSSYGAHVVLTTGLSLALSGPSGLALDAAGDLYVADSGNARVLLLSSSSGQPLGSLITTVGSGFTTPVAVAVDNLGNVYVSDSGTNKVVQLTIATGVQTTIVSPTTPAGIAVDAGGSLYVVDSGAQTISRIPNVSGSLSTSGETTLATVVATPHAIALDSSGNLYAVDSSHAIVSELNRSQGSLSFGNVNELVASAAITAFASDGGTLALTLGSPYYTATGSTTSFALDGSSTCSAGSTVNPGADCTIASVFTPQSIGVLAETLSLSSNASNSATVALSGTGTQLPSTTLALAITPTGTISVGQAITLTATLTPAAGGTGTPSGTVTFYVGGAYEGVASLASNAASITLPSGLSAGSQTITANYSGDANYASSAASALNITVAGLSSTLAVAVTSPTGTITQGQAVTVQATLTPTAGSTPTPTGTITLTVDSTQQSPVTLTGLSASTRLTSLTSGQHTIYATYSGDANYAVSTSATLTVSVAAPPAATNSMVFSQTSYVSPVNSVLGESSNDYGGHAGRLAANSRGDVFFDGGTYVAEIPANGSPQVNLVTGMGSPYGGASVYIDSSGNLYITDTGDAEILYVPFVNGAYPASVANSAVSACSAFPVPSTTTATCYVSLNYPYGYASAADVALDGSGNLYIVDKYTGGSYSGAQVNKIIKFSAQDGTATVVVDNLANQASAQLAVDKAGDIYYVDGNNASYYAAGSSTAVSFNSGLNGPAGVTLDSGGNLYVTDSVNSSTVSSRIIEIPYLNGARSTTNQFTLTEQPAANGTQSINASVAVDGFGKIYFVGGYNNSINRLVVDALNFPASAVATASSPSSLSLYFGSAVTFGSFTATGPFAVSTQTCTQGTAYAVDATCTVGVTYTATAAGPQSGQLLAYNAAGTQIGHASLSGSGQASLFNVDPGTVTAVGSAWTAPSAIATDTAGNIFVADSSTGNVYETTVGSTTQTSVASGFSSPSAIVVDAGGNLYVGDAGNSQIVKVPNYQGTYGTPTVVETGLKGASGLALDVAGNLYVADSGNARVLLLSSAGGQPIGSLTSTFGSGFTTPVAVAVDSAGGFVYVSDDGAKQVVQVAITKSAQVPIVTGMTTAAGIAVDAGGSLYVADSGAKTIVRIPNVSGALNNNLSYTLGTAVATPNAISLDASGNLYATDTADKTVAYVSRTVGLLNFGNANVLATTSTISANISDGGNTALTLSTPYYTASDATGNFAVMSSSTCVDGLALAPGTACTVSANFTPQALGTFSDTLAFASDPAAGSLVLRGKGTHLTTSTLTLAVTSPTTAPVFGQAITVAATLVPVAGGVGTPTGTITFLVDNFPHTPITLSSNSGSIVLTGLTGGQHTVTASYSGDDNYASAAASALSLTIGTTTATTTVTITAPYSNPTSQNPGGAVTLTATVALGGPVAPTGTVTFYSGTTALGTATVSPIQTTAKQNAGQANFTTSSLASGQYNITATYSGDANYSASTSTSSVPLLISVAAVTVTASSANIVAGQALSLSIGSSAGFSGTADLACSGLPKYATCSFSPAFAVITPQVAQAVSLTVLVDQAPVIAVPSARGTAPLLPGNTAPMLASLFLIPAVWLGLAMRRAGRKGRGIHTTWQSLLVVSLLLAGCAATLGGCGSSSSSSSGAYTTPKGTSTITVTATISSKAVQTITLQLTVN